MQKWWKIRQKWALGGLFQNPGRHKRAGHVPLITSKSHSKIQKEMIKYNFYSPSPSQLHPYRASPCSSPHPHLNHCMQNDFTVMLFTRVLESQKSKSVLLSVNLFARHNFWNSHNHSRKYYFLPDLQKACALLFDWKLGEEIKLSESN